VLLKRLKGVQKCFKTEQKCFLNSATKVLKSAKKEPSILMCSKSVFWKLVSTTFRTLYSLPSTFGTFYEHFLTQYYVSLRYYVSTFLVNLDPFPLSKQH